MMKFGLILKVLPAVVLTVTLSSCLTQRTVSSGGHIIKQDIVVTRPLKNAIENTP